MKTLVLRTCNNDMTSYEGFQWPTSGYVEAPDWDGGLVKCGGKLHGLLWGCGAGHLLDWDSDAKWLVVEVDGECVDLAPVDGSVKVGFRGGNVVHVGDQKSATDYLLSHGAADKPVVGCWKTGGHNSILTGGYYSTLTSGNCSTLTGGDYSTLTSGDYSILTGGKCSTLTGGYGSTLTGGYGSTLTGGDNSTLTWKVVDGNRYRFYTFYVGEDGVLPNTKYRFDNGLKMVS